MKNKVVKFLSKIVSSTTLEGREGKMLEIISSILKLEHTKIATKTGEAYIINESQEFYAVLKKNVNSILVCSKGIVTNLPVSDQFLTESMDLVEERNGLIIKLIVESIDSYFDSQLDVVTEESNKEVTEELGAKSALTDIG